jgi:maltose-binding protein MalE
MHGIAAKALETTKKSIPNIPEFLPIVDSLSVAMSNIVTGGGENIKEQLDLAAAAATRIMKRA